MSTPATSIPPPAPYGPVPTPGQLAQHRREFYGFIHFTTNTFTGKEWGYGDESPAIFNPTQLDARQWARVAKAAGMTGLILTCKHHDGFCLWPSAHTAHSVRSSPWQGGRGDVVRELTAACREHQLEFGVYLSPWDRNHPEYGRAAYPDYYRRQLRELLTGYGEIFEVWFDGANGGDGFYGGARETRKIDAAVYYGWDETRRLVRELQPNAIMFSDVGPDIRWVGNESGVGAETTWCRLDTQGRHPGMSIANLGEGEEEGSSWLPPETDVSIRPGWFYHAAEDSRVKSVKHLLDIYFQSVGRGSTLLLNLPPDSRGLLHEADCDRLRRFRQALDLIFARDLARGATATASSHRGQAAAYAPACVNDGNPASYWATDDGVCQGWVELAFPAPCAVNTFVFQEQIALGQRVKAWTLEGRVQGQWQALGAGTTIGYKRMLRGETVTVTALRLRIAAAKACPTLAAFQAYLAPVLLPDPEIRRDSQGRVTLTAGPGTRVRYTTDGSAPTATSPVFTQALPLPRGGTIAAAVFAADHPGACAIGAGTAVVRRFGLAKERWRVVAADSEETSAHDGRAANAIDEDPASLWHTEWSQRQPPPHWLVLDLGSAMRFTALGYLPRQDGHAAALVERCAVYASQDGQAWGEPVATGRFDNIQANPIEQIVRFPAPVTARFIKFVALGMGLGQPYASAAELNLYAD